MYASTGAETEITIGNIPHKVNILLTPTTQRRKKKEKQFKSLEHNIRWRLLRLNQTPTVDLLFLQRWLTKQDPLCSSKNRKNSPVKILVSNQNDRYHQLKIKISLQAKQKYPALPNYVGTKYLRLLCKSKYKFFL